MMANICGAAQTAKSMNRRTSRMAANLGDVVSAAWRLQNPRAKHIDGVKHLTAREARERCATWMARAVVLMFAIEARLPPALRRGARADQPLTLPTPRPSVTAAEMGLRDDVMVLVARLARTDPLGARVVAHRGLGAPWPELRKLDPRHRDRARLDKVRKRALLNMVKIDCAERLAIISRTAEMFDR